MPNWCNNHVEFRHSDPAMIDRIVAAKDGLLEAFIPCPVELREHSAPEQDEARAARFREQYGASDWYTWSVNNWGTKWDVSLNHVSRDYPNEVTVTFDSAWSPPIEAYAKLEALGFEVEAYYNEPGMAFFGSYIEGVEDTIDYSSMTANQIRTEFPELDERFCVSDWMDESTKETE